MSALDPELIELLTVQVLNAEYADKTGHSKDVKVTFWATDVEPLPTYLEYVTIVDGQVVLGTSGGRLERLSSSCPAFYELLAQEVVRIIEDSEH